ncbi:hypothetical protein ABFG93_22390 (plasmid) [Pseudalkalibacillus hwajinpoensis]|uniref:hypothetical protein n=1 Tax=Guptibacillus hwajinpoensis TaxID=208199 RepID=UPI00325AF33C
MALKYSGLKEKDLEYMTFVLRNGVVTAKQIKLKFREPNLSRVYRRLQKLEDRGYLKHERVAHKVGVYYGTQDARDIANVSATIPQKATIYTMQHELLMTDLILFYEFQAEKKGVTFRYKSEREIRFEMIGEGDNQSKLKAFNEKRDRIPDAVFFFILPNNQETTTWVELELNKKDRKRYEEKFKLFEDLLSGKKHEDYRYAFDQVMYFADEIKIHKLVNEAKQKLVNGMKIVVKDIPSVVLDENWDEVMSSGRTSHDEAK